MENLIITAQGTKTASLVTKISELCATMECSIAYAQGKDLSTESVFFGLVHGKWNCIAKLETALEKLKSDSGVHVTYQRSQPSMMTKSLIPYEINIIAVDQTSIVQRVCEFLHHQSISIESFMAETYQAGDSQTAMLALNFTLGVPPDMNIANLREQFMVFCDDLNIDGLLEPHKP